MQISFILVKLQLNNNNPHLIHNW